jgi:hypothetical protein
MMTNSLDDIKIDTGRSSKNWRLLLIEDQTEPTIRAILWIIRNDGGRILIKEFPSNWPDVLYQAILIKHMRRATFMALSLNVREAKKNRLHDPRWDGPNIAV